MKPSKKFSISVVIPNYNGATLLTKHLPNVIKHTPGAEIIVVDDNSTDDSIKVLKINFPTVKIVALEKNNRFAAACNAGFASAKGDIVILLNSDVSPKKGYLQPLLKHFKNNQIFAVGCKETQLVNGQTQKSGRGIGDFKRGFLVHWKPKNQNKSDTLWTTGGSMAASRKIWHQLGGMDTIYKPAYWEDIDISYRAKKLGYQVIFEPKSIVFHNHETTNVKELGRFLMKLSAYKNQFLFVWKNITDFSFILQHLLWLPFHLIFTTIRSKGLFLLGFFWAIIYLPQVLSSRISRAEQVVNSDHNILALLTN